MKNEYLYWKRFEDDVKNLLEALEERVFINTKLLKFAQSEIAKLPEPKIKEKKNEK